MATPEKYIHFHRYSFGPEERQAVLDTMDSGWLTKGPKVSQFEAAFAAYTHTPAALALNSCTAGLHLALLAYHIGPGDEVITTPLTFVATVNMIVTVGAKPVLVDIEPGTLNIDPAQIRRHITPRTKAILPVHYAGQPCNMQEILAIGQEFNIPIIEDAAHAVGAHYQGKPIGSLGDMTVFSFYATKNITTGEGGMITSRHVALLNKLRPLSLHGLSQDAWTRYSDQGYRHYLVENPGFKYNMTDMQAALGLEQLKKCDDLLHKRKLCCEFYEAGLKDLPLDFLKIAADVSHSYHLFPIQLQLEDLSITRDEAIHYLHQQGIGSAVHFLPVHSHPYYRQLLGDLNPTLPVATQAGERLLSLPLYPDLSRSDQERVIHTLAQLLTTHSR